MDLEHAVADRGTYRASVLSSVDFGPATLSFCCGSEVIYPTLLTPKPATEEGFASEYTLPTGDTWQPFKLAYGFVAPGVSISVPGEAPRSVSTRSIPCSCCIANLKKHVVGMLDALLGPDLAPAVKLMTVKGDDGSPNESTTQGEGSSSVEAFVAHADSVLTLVEEAIPALKLRPRTKSRSAQEVVDPKRARNVGRAEAEWLTRNPDAITVGKGGSVARARQCASWHVSRVQTSVERISLDVPENMAVLGLLQDIVRASSSLLTTLNEGIRGLEAAKSKLSAISVNEGCLPSMVIVDAQLERAHPRIALVEALRLRAKRDLRTLEVVWGLQAPRKYILPRRSKAFQEIPHYVRVYKAMLAWFEYGKVNAEKEALMLEIRSMPRLYELFCLANLVDYHLKLGYAASEPELVAYSLSSRYFSNERRVANKYSFSKGQASSTLWYQAVFYSDRRDEGGLGVHRTTKSTNGSQSMDSYWTPDFVLRQAGPDTAERMIVLDSKYSEPGYCRDYYADCVDKYKHCSIRSNGRPIDSVWLLCGRGDAGQGWSEELGTWALEAGMLPDGLCVFSPFVNELDHAIPAVDTGRGIHREAATAVAQATQAGRGRAGAEGAKSSEKDAGVSLQDQQDQRMPEPSGRVTEEPELAGQAAEPGPGSEAANATSPEKSLAGKSELEPEPAGRTAAESGGAKAIGEAGIASQVRPLVSRLASPDEQAKSPAGATEPVGRTAKSAGKVETSAGQTTKSKAKPEISYEVVRMLSSLAQTPFFKDKLTDARMSQMQFGVSHPICRTRQPDEKDRKRYTRQPVDIAGTEYYLYKDWRPDQLNKLKRTFAKRSS